MKKMNKLTAVALALVAIGFASTAASAQTVTSNFGDLILGFEEAGVPTDLEVDLGPLSNFTSATSTLNLSSLLNVGDLVSTFGAGWATSVSWGAAAAIGDGLDGGNNKNNIALTFATPNLKPAAKAANGVLGTANSAIFSLETSGSALNGAPVAGTNSSALIGNASTTAANTPGSWSNSASALAGITSKYDALGATTNELFSYTGGSTASTGTVTDLGQFSLGSTGSLSFTPAAVPEPSAYALGICAVLLFIVLRRRATVA